MACQPPVSYADPRDVGELVEPLRSRVHTIIIDAPNDGLVLISGRRSPWQQWLLRHERCPGRECDRGCRGVPTTAIPYASKHQTGEAADLGGRSLDWAHDNANRYGMSAEVVPSENWHFQIWGEPSVRIIAYGDRPPDVPSDPNAGRKWIAFLPFETDSTIYARGGLNNQVVEMQWRLASFALRTRTPKVHPGFGDGIYGPKTQHAVMQFKVWVVKMIDATGQPQTWSRKIDAKVGPKFIAMLRWWSP